MLIEFPSGVSLAELQTRYRYDDLVAATHEMADTMLGLIADAKDSYVTFLPDDPEANDPHAADPAEIHMPWTLAHVIVHATASSEEAAALGSFLARGVPIDFRSRYEVPWREVTTVQQLVHRLEENRRIRLAYLEAWPNPPLLETVFTKGHSGPLNAVGYTLRGFNHDHNHLGQIAEIMRQARVALG